jgi:hypothetical protein
MYLGQYLPIFFVKTENKKNIKNNIEVAPLNQNFTRFQTIEVENERLSPFSLIVNFIIRFYL